MYHIYFNDEADELVLNFEEIAESHSEYLDDCYEYFERALKKFYINQEMVDSYQDYMYFIALEGAKTKRDFWDFEDYLRELFDYLEERIEDDLEEANQAQEEEF